MDVKKVESSDSTFSNTRMPNLSRQQTELDVTSVLSIHLYIRLFSYKNLVVEVGQIGFFPSPQWLQVENQTL